MSPETLISCLTRTQNREELQNIFTNDPKQNENNREDCPVLKKKRSWEDAGQNGKQL